VPNIVPLRVSSSDREQMTRLYTKFLPESRGPIFLILDSDHSAKHVLDELELHIPFLRSGDYLVVEDTVVNGHPVRPDHGPGPMEALEEYLRRHKFKLVPDKAHVNKFGSGSAHKGYFTVR
jgi:cephalosporin hydroxylase